MKSSFRVVDLTYMAICSALIAICSWISIPTTVPFTLQTFAVFCVLELLGGKRGTVSICIFILLGAIGIPVFTGFRGGIGVLLGTTGGYIVGFIFMGLIYWLSETLFGEKLVVRFAAMAVGLIVCYTFGTAWFLFVYARSSGAIGVGTALSWCVFPFVLPDLVKMALAITLSGRIKKYLH
ncbi:MAG: biotin transporter BioY [Oscillospiraceae bacterium]|nr:biotin transporter BioY [Oscillospiraceae bacterium]MBO7422061.1 biotin transporter BioY [Oscillospiraceae bacterium]MBO7727603.1 biotin transporter BioY [Oscillospiraceae bacterium]MBP5168598.1 biotin transporter BioY [Oscillospiraceae bacterium]